MAVRKGGALWIALAACLGTVAFAFLVLHRMEATKMPRVHRLEFPLLLQGGDERGGSYLLPKGTSLYYEHAFPEGFVQYRVYINIDGIKLDSRELADPTAISPLTAYPIDKSELLKLLKQYPLSKSDLAAVLRSGELSKDEIRSLLEEFAR